MSRSGYTDDCENLNLYRGTVTRTIKGKRGQAFLKELLKELDAMPEKRLISDELVAENGECCALGVMFVAKGIEDRDLDIDEPRQIAERLGITWQLAAEIEYENDENSWRYALQRRETPEERWSRMRKWVADNIDDN